MAEAPNPEVPAAPGDPVDVNRRQLRDVINTIESLLAPRTSAPLPADLVSSLAETKRKAIEALSRIGVRGGKTRRKKHLKSKHKKTRRHSKH